MTKEILTRMECSAMRGIAILAIMLHNYCHFIGSIVKENEYQYLSGNNDLLWQALGSPTDLLPVHLLSYFGHYGVAVFLFLSGFGLVKKYEGGGDGDTSRTSRTSRTSCPGVASFLGYHYLKLLRMLIVGFPIFLTVDAVTPGRFAFHWENVVAQLLMYINVLPEPDRIIWPGIYWFFGLMMELYIVYRLVIYRRSSVYVVGLIAVCWLLQAFAEPDGELLNRLRYNFIGGMLPFGLGILLARLGRKEAAGGGRILWGVTALMATVAVFVMSFSFHSWLWIPVVIVIGTVAIVKSMPEGILKLFMWFGGISAAMFVAHPIARKLFITVAWKQDIYDGLMLYLIVTIALSWAVKQIIDHIPAPRL